MREIDKVALEALMEAERSGAGALRHLFDEGCFFPIASLSPEILHDENAPSLESPKKLLEQMQQEFAAHPCKEDLFASDYLLRKYTSLLASGTEPVSLYESAKARALFAAVDFRLERDEVDADAPLLMICGDFFDIQRFIFDSVPTDKASKILRAKSAYVQLLSKVIAFWIVEALNLSYLSIISTHAGKFEILGVNTATTREKLDAIQKDINRFFITTFFAQTGVSVSAIPCQREELLDETRYREDLRARIAQAVERSKYGKFDLVTCDPVLASSYKEELDNENLCKLCNKRKITDEYCDICHDFERIGRELANKRHLTISRGSGHIHLIDDYYINFIDTPRRLDNAIAVYDISKAKEFTGYAKWELSSYVKRNDEQEVETFEVLAQNSCQGEENGIEALMGLKADVDGMGRFIREESSVTGSFMQYNFFARMMDYFFSVSTAHMMEGQNLYTVFAGGDDLFILGAWDEVIAFATELKEEFARFARGSGMTLSMGLVLTKPNKPISFVAHLADDAEMRAKSYISPQGEAKNAIDLFGETLSFPRYEAMKQRFDDEILPKALIYQEQFNTAFWYRLLTFCDMAARVRQGDVEATLWKSKLRYSFSRNILEKVDKDEAIQEALEQVVCVLDGLISEYDAALKMVLFELIYKRRDR